VLRGEGENAVAEFPRVWPVAGLPNGKKGRLTCNEKWALFVT
jgi:hypothetical protein